MSSRDMTKSSTASSMLQLDHYFYLQQITDVKHTTVGSQVIKIYMKLLNWMLIWSSIFHPGSLVLHFSVLYFTLLTFSVTLSTYKNSS